MLKCVLKLIFLILIATGVTFSQTIEQQVAKIRVIYNETNRRIAAGVSDNTIGLHYATWTIGGKGDNQQWSAVGTMEMRAEIWFDGELNDGEENSQNTPQRLIRKIVWNYKGAADLHTRTEYFFDENGNPVFIFSRDDAASESGKIIERRFYYNKGKLLRIMRGGKNSDAEFSVEDLQAAKDENENARRLQNKFAAIFVD